MAVRILLVLALCVLAGGGISTMGHCVPACPAPATVEQPDGTQISVVLRGDEHFHWNEDTSGYLVKQSPKTRQWMYAVDANGVATPTEHVVGRVDPAAVGLPKPDIRRMQATARSLQLQPAVNNAPVYSSKTGTMKNLVVLVNFSDLAVAYTRQQYDDLFNQIGYTADGAVGSVKDFYHEISYNALTVESTVVEAVTLDHGYAYYGANDSNGNDVKPREMVAEALTKLEQRGFDFRTVDGDGDGWVDGLTIIHAGGGEEYSGNNTSYIWSHEWQLINTLTFDGVRMSSYHTEPARRGWDSSSSSQGITRIGVICHETGHFLGLPDLYDYDYDSKGVGNFCLMAGGSWGGDYGNRPVQMSAWCRANLGWLTPTVIASAGSYSLSQVETSQQIYKIQSAGASNEYFLIENRRGVGFDQSLPGSSRGLLIWHVDESRSDNDDQTHYKVDLEEASCTQHLETNANAGDDADYYRSGNVTDFTGLTCPNNKSYAGTACVLSVVNVGAAGSTMTFNITSSACTPPVINTQPISQSACSGSAVYLSVGALGSDLHYQWQSQPGTGGAWTNVGLDGSTYATTPTVADNGSSYRCIVTNTCGTATSDPAVIVVNPRTGTTSPSNQLVCAGSAATFSVTGSGYGPFSYRWLWQANGGNGLWYDIGANSSTLSFVATIGDNGKKYRCVVTGGCGSSGSNPATLTVVVPINTSDAKLLADGQQAALRAKAITYTDSDFFYVEEDSRGCGIRVEKTAHGLAVGDRADAIGPMSTNTNKERLIAATSVTKNGAATLAPLAIRPAAVGGNNWHYDDITHAGQKGVSGSFGLNSVGLLVTTWGHFEKLTPATFTLDDGSGPVVRCIVKPGVTLSSAWKYLTVTGICSMYADVVAYPPAILVRDIQVAN